ncbi:uncharacterized protein LOC141905025 isoform X2 [Tubulanus polymorphus]|uniref:uncharacterized protein LOC141905025 isoform X2 n=1 Tax=Tubulanus polymorphus TaxID=672921 RepID=UPI003DA270A4
MSTADETGSLTKMDSKDSVDDADLSVCNNAAVASAAAAAAAADDDDVVAPVDPSALDEELRGAVGFTAVPAIVRQSDINKLLDEANENVFDDNTSLEVNLGDGSSRRTSDVSSLSFQNIVLDDPDYDDDDDPAAVGRGHDSDDSADSIQNDPDHRRFMGLDDGDDDDEIARLNAPDDEDIDLDVYKQRIMKLEQFPGMGASSAGSKSDSPSDYELIKDPAACESASVDMRSESDRDNISLGSRGEINILQGQGHLFASASGDVVGGEAHDGFTDTVMRRSTQQTSCTTTASSEHADSDISDISTSTAASNNMELSSAARKRNSLEIRNNIPNANEVKAYNDSDNSIYYSNHQARMKKKSPGLAQRMDEADEANPRRPEREYLVEGAYNHRNFGSNYPINGSGVNNGLPSDLRSRSRSDSGSTSDRRAMNGVDIENEYDYIKFARIHQGDAYVGMRLAYSSSNDSLNCQHNNKRVGVAGWGGADDEQTSPDKPAVSPVNAEDIRKHTERMAAAAAAAAAGCAVPVIMNEDNLTEIPLNGDPTANNSDDSRKFTLSPEATECDSAEVESVISEEGKSSAGMPNVEDGLSSSATSDVEDNHEPAIMPAEILRKRQRAEVELGLVNPMYMRQLMIPRNTAPNVGAAGSYSYSHENLNVVAARRNNASEYSQTLPLPQRAGAATAGFYQQKYNNMSNNMRGAASSEKISQDALDLAMQDIKTAIRRSKSMTLKTTSYRNSTEIMDSCDSEPVWVKRDPNTEQHLKRQEEMRLVREHLERQQEEAEDANDDEDDDELEYRRREEELRREEDDDDLTSRQYIKNDGKKYQKAKGFDSDEEFEDNERPLSGRFTQRIRGLKRYQKLPVDDASSDSNYMSSDTYRENPGGATVTSANEPLKNAVAAETANVSQKNLANLKQQTKQQTGIPYSNEQNTALSNNGPVYEGECMDSDCEHGHATKVQEGEFDTDEETDQLLDKEYKREENLDIPELSRPPVNRSAQAEKRRSRAKEDMVIVQRVAISDPDEPTVLIEGVLFRAKYLGSTQLISEGQPSKAMRMMQAQEAVGRIKANNNKPLATTPTMPPEETPPSVTTEKAPEGDSQPSTEVDLFVSTEKIMVLNTDLQEIMMDHSLRTISYIADIGDIVVIMARRRMITSPGDEMLRRKKQSKIICHVFECDEAQLIAQSIGQAFQVAYMEFLKANGIEDPGLMKEMDYQEVLNQQEIFGEELSLFANRDTQKEVIVPKLKGEPLGVVIVESGWGSMVPTVVLANMSPTGAAARCGQLNIGDQIMSINGVSLVGLSLTSCQSYIKAAKNQTVVKLTVVQCAPVVEVLIKRPDVKYQLGFSVQNGVICSLLRGGIAERGGVRVGHRIIEINGHSVVAVAHEKIVNMLATSVGEIHMKTMPTSIYRLLTGQETPHYI